MHSVCSTNCGSEIHDSGNDVTSAAQRLTAGICYFYYYIPNPPLQKRLASLGVDYGRLHPEFLQISEAKSVATMCDVFGVSYPNNATTIRPSFVINETTEHRYKARYCFLEICLLLCVAIRFDNSYFKEDLEEASSVKTETESKNTTLGDKIEGDIQNDVSHIDKKVKVEHDR